MICLNCKTAADLMEAAADLFTWDLSRFGGSGTSDALGPEDGPAALCVAAAIVKLYGRCPGGTWCDSQRRGTPYERKSAST